MVTALRVITIFCGSARRGRTTATVSVEPGSPAVQKRGDELRGVLEVSVHHDHGIARGMSKPGAQGRLMTEVARQQQIIDPRIGPVKLSENLLA